MDYQQVAKRMNDEIDRLSNLPDDLIHKILSFVGIKCAIELSALSTRWRYIWTSMPHLNFLFKDFYTSNFVSHLLSRRNNLVEVFSIKLCFDDHSSQVFVKQLLNYAFSHNIQQLDIIWIDEGNIESPLSRLIRSQSLTHLSMRRKCFYQTDRRYGVRYNPTLELPALTTLYLHDFTLSCDENIDKRIFSKCANLNNLTLKSCKVIGLNGLNICHPLLSNLTLEDVQGSFNVVNVVAPQLKNLTIDNGPKKYQYLISAPSLVSLLYKGHHCMDLSTDGIHLLEKADLCVTGNASARKIICLFQHLQSVKFLTLNLEIVELLSLSVELILNQPSPYANLKSLHIYPVKELSEVRNDVEMSSEVKNYLLENSPSATFTMVSREESRVRKDTKLAQNQMESLQVMLEHEKTKMENQITQVENLLQIGGKMTHVNRCWEGLSDRIEQGKKKD